MKETPLIVEVRNLLELPQSWIRDRAAEDRFGRPCRSEDLAAVRFSLLGAIKKASIGRHGRRAAQQACIRIGEKLALRLGHDLSCVDDRSDIAIDLIAAFNRIATHASIISLLDECIEQNQV